MPPIGKADHDIVYVEYDIKAKRLKQASRKIYLYKRADMVGLKDHMTQFKDAYLSEDHSHMSVNDMWVKFKTGFVEAVERFIPSKMTKTKYSVPWIDLTIKRLVKKRNKLYLRARKSKDPDVKIHYKRFRAHVHKVLRDAYWKYSLEARRERSSLLLFHKIHSGAVSIEKDKYLTPARSLKSTRSSHSAQYCRYQTYSDALKNSFFPRTIPQWNSLSPSAVNSQTAEELRTLLI